MSRRPGSTAPGPQPHWQLGEAAMRVPPAAWWQAFARRMAPVRPEGSGNGQ
jgi:hypothetical protein